MRDAIQLVEYGPEFGQQGLSDRRPDLHDGAAVGELLRVSSLTPTLALQAFSY